MSLTARPHRRTAAISAAAVALAGSSTLLPVAAAAASPDTAGNKHRPLVVDAPLDGTFTFTRCPAGSAAGDFCLTDHVVGRIDVLGRVTGDFAVTIRFGQAVGDCAPITKRGTFTSGRGSLTVDATGTYCATPAIAVYVIETAIGAGRLAGYTGSGSWVVPAPTGLTATGGSGPETVTVALSPRG